MDLELAKFLFQVMTFLLTGGIGIYVYISNKDKVTNDRIGKLEDDIDDKLDIYSERIAKLEAGPSKDDIKELHQKVNGVSDGVSALRGEFSATQRILQLIHETLMERK